MRSAGVDLFFAAATAYLWGRAPADELVLALGPSPSGATRLDFYRRLMAANRRRILRQVYPTLAEIFAEPARVGILSLPTWDDLVDAYAACHPATSWDPNDFGRQLPAWLATTDVPSPLVHIADWSWRLLAAARAPRADTTGATATADRLDPSVGAAVYPFDVPRWVRRFSAGQAVTPLVPPPAAPTPMVIVVYRHPHSWRTRYLQPSPAELVVLAQAAGEHHPSDGVEGTEPARRRLTELGLIRGARP
jgi:hypothetical protein